MGGGGGGSKPGIIIKDYRINQIDNSRRILKINVNGG